MITFPYLECDESCMAVYLSLRDQQIPTSTHSIDKKVRLLQKW
jgi:hypothetical protein